MLVNLNHGKILGVQFSKNLNDELMKKSDLWKTYDEYDYQNILQKT